MIWLRSDRAVWRQTPDAVIALGVDGADPVVLEGPAVSLWELLAQPRSESDVMKTLAKTYEVDVDVVAHDVGPLLVQLRDSGVVECRP